jgi:hypothetical protein
VNADKAGKLENQTNNRVLLSQENSDIGFVNSGI